MKDKISQRIKQIQDDTNGFSLINLVVAVGIAMVLTIGGIIGYSQISKNSKIALYQSQTSDIYTSVVNNNLSPQESKSTIKELLANTVYKNHKSPSQSKVLVSGSISCPSTGINANFSKVDIFNGDFHTSDKIADYIIITDSKNNRSVLIRDSSVKDDAGNIREFVKQDSGFDTSCKITW